LVRDTLPEIEYLDNEYLPRLDENVPNSKCSSARPLNRAKSESKILKQQKKLLTLNFNLEK